MQKIEALVRRSIRERVRDVLVELGIQRVTLTDVCEAPSSGAPQTFYRGAAYAAEIPETKIEAIVADADVDTVVQAIVTTARDAGSVDGRILVLPIRHVVSIAHAAAESRTVGAQPREAPHLPGRPRSVRGVPAQRVGERNLRRL